jgi:uncharacterized protein
LQVWIERNLQAQATRLASQRPALLVTGARQSGKTALVRHVFPQHRYVSLDLPSEAEQAEREPAAFLERHGTPLVIDEVQYAPSIFRHLKSRIDARRPLGGESGEFILTGSQAFSLMHGVSESLAGRVGLLELEGLSYSEARASTPRLDPVDFALRGAFPELWSDPDLDAKSFHHAYVASYLERDVRSVLNVSSLRDFERFLRACALRSAQVLNKADLARDVGISPSTADKWLSVLSASDQIYLLEPWFSNRTKSLVKSPKLYLNDSGLLCFLLGVSSSLDLLASPFAGPVWETLVCAELRRQLRFGVRPGQLFYFRDRTKEVDFVIHRGGRFELYEAKWTEQPNASDLRSIQKVSEDLGQRSITRSGVICRVSNPYPLGEGSQALPLSQV